MFEVRKLTSILRTHFEHNAVCAGPALVRESRVSANSLIYRLRQRSRAAVKVGAASVRCRDGVCAGG
jgi:hypothetical protein